MDLPKKRGSSIFDVVGMAAFGKSKGSLSTSGLAGREAAPTANLFASALRGSIGKVENPMGVARPPLLEEFILDAPEELREKRASLSYFKLPNWQDRLENSVSWGTIVIGENLGNGWLRCGEAFLPMTLDGCQVIVRRSFEPKLVPKTSPKMKQPLGWDLNRFSWNDRRDVHDDETEDSSDDDISGAVVTQAQPGALEEEMDNRSSSPMLKSSTAPASSTDSPRRHQYDLSPTKSDAAYSMASQGSAPPLDACLGPPVDKSGVSFHLPGSGAKHKGRFGLADVAALLGGSGRPSTTPNALEAQQPASLMEGRVVSCSSLTSFEASSALSDVAAGGDGASADTGTQRPLKDEPEANEDPEDEDNKEEEGDDDEEPVELVSKLPIEARLPALEQAYWRAPGGMRAPHLEPVRHCADDLQEAALRGDIGLLRRLIEAGVSVNAPIRPATSDEFLTLLHILSCRELPIPNVKRVLVELLKTKANPDVRSSMGATPLMLACLHKNISAAQVLLEFGASAWAVDDNGRTAMRCAMIPDPNLQHSEDASVQLAQLLGAAGAPLDEGGAVSPMVEAVLQHSGAAVRSLIELRATPDGLNEAVHSAPVSIIADLIEAEANPFHRDASGKTIMEIALVRGEECITTMLRDYIGDLERSAHSHLQTREKYGVQVAFESPLTSAKQNNPDVFKFERQRRGNRASLASRLAEQAMLEQRHTTPLWRALHRLQVCSRRIIRTYTFQTISLLFLFLALFLPDAWIIANADTIEPLDIMITVVFFGFLLEWILQMLGLQRSYIGKFNFWMDMLGCWSVPLDHSFVTKSITNSFSSMDSSTLAQITKLVKLGARAGRLSRLVKLLRFLPGMQEKSQSVGTARKMSKMINMRISLQVAAIIIIMVIILPLLEVGRFPTDDHSLVVWTKLLEKSAVDYPDDLGTVVSEMAEFYSNMNYQPYQVSCVFSNGTAGEVILGQQPKRIDDRVEVRIEGIAATVLFDFRRPHLTEAICNVCLIIVIVMVMFTSALLVSNAVSSIVLTPLERLLNVVKDVANRIFSSVENLAAKTAASGANNKKKEDSDSDDEEGNEAKGLEKVLKKLEAFGELNAKKSPMEEADALGIKEIRNVLSDYLPHVTPVVEKDKAVGARLMQASGERELDLELVDEIRSGFASGGIDWVNFSAWEFDVTELSSLQLDMLCIGLMKLYKMPDIAEEPSTVGVMSHGPSRHSLASLSNMNLPGEIPVDDLDSPMSPKSVSSISSRRSSVANRRRSSAGRRKLENCNSDDMNSAFVNFVMAVATGYADRHIVPYHNFVHAVDVAVTLHHMLRTTRAAYIFARHERLALMASALGHDIGHGGYTNDFLVTTGDEVALRYNDCSPLEAMHSARLFEICSKPGSAIFSNLGVSLYREVRKVCIDAILHTDNHYHFSMVQDIDLLYDMRHDLFDHLHALEQNSGELGSECYEPPPMDFIEFFAGSPENISMLRNFFLRFADQSNSLKSFAQSQFWGDRMLEEFFLQGDRERDLGLPVHSLRDRERLNRPFAHIHIIELCVAPMAKAAGRLLPGLARCQEQLRDNALSWLEDWRQNGDSTEEEYKRVDERISKMMQRDPPKPSSRDKKKSHRRI